MTCAGLTDSLSNSRDKEVQKQKLLIKADDEQVIRAERQMYYDKRRKAKLNRDEYMSIIIDGADQSAYGLPYFYQSSKATEGPKVRCKLYGVIVHGRSTHLYALPMNYHSGVNMTVQVLHDTLTYELTVHGRLPPTLYLQLDNTSGQNNSNYLMAYLSLLIQWKVFKVIEVSFLPKGHTHEDIDQLFSRIAVYAKWHNAMTIQDLLHNCRMAYQKPIPHVSVIKDQAAFKERCELLRKQKLFCLMDHVTDPASFRFEQGSNGQGQETAVCYVKSMTSSSNWRCHLTDPSIDRPHAFFSADVTPEKFFDEDIFPNAWTKDIDEEELNEIMKNVERCAEREVFKLRHQEELKDLLNKMRAQEEIPFQWDLTLYQNSLNESKPSCSDDESIGSCSQTSGHSESASDGLQSGSDGHESSADSEPRIVVDPQLVPSSSMKSKKIKVLYEVGEFLIIRTPRDHPDPFWIGKCLESVKSDAKEVEVKWYVLNSRGTDHLRHAYVPYNGISGKGKTRKEMKVNDKVHKFSKGTIDVRSIHMVFKELSDGKIPPKVAKAYTEMAKTTTGARLV